LLSVPASGWGLSALAEAGVFVVAVALSPLI
jgi:hypothetical protein